jgi:hypothetical protein
MIMAISTEADVVEQAYIAFFSNAQSGGSQHGGRLPSFEGGLPYRAQFGGLVPAFHGAQPYRQNGAGFGSAIFPLLKNVFRYLFPVLIQGGATAIGAFNKNRDEGKSVGDSVRSAIAPTAQTVLSSGAEQIDKYTKEKEQKGSGKRRKRRKTSRVYKKVKKRHNRRIKHKRKRTRRRHHKPSIDSIKYNF